MILTLKPSSGIEILFLRSNALPAAFNDFINAGSGAIEVKICLVWKA